MTRTIQETVTHPAIVVCFQTGRFSQTQYQVVDLLTLNSRRVTRKRKLNVPPTRNLVADRGFLRAPGSQLRYARRRAGATAKEGELAALSLAHRVRGGSW